MLEPAEPVPAGETLSASIRSESASAAPVSRHTASCFQRSARRVRRIDMRDTKTAAAGASALARSTVSVRFQFVVIVCLLRSPAVVPVASVSAPGFGSRAGLSGPLFRPFDRVQVSENHAFPELAFRGAAFAAFVRSVRPVFRPPRRRLASARSGLASSFRRPPRRRLASAWSGSASDSVSTPPSEFPVYHPVPASCSARLLFVLFMVRISKFCFCFARSVLLSLSRSFRSLVRPVQPVHFRFVLSSIYRVRLFACGFIYIFLAYIIHLNGRKQNVFFIEKHVLFTNKVCF